MTDAPVPAPTQAPAPASPPPRPSRWPQWIRTVHLYSSLVGLVLMLFFGATGFVMHHEEWFGLGRTVTSEQTGAVTARLEPLDDLALVEELRRTFHIEGGLVRLDTDPDAYSLRFSSPGQDTDVWVTRPSGEVKVETERGRLQDVLADLHKGNRVNGAGALLVDAGALLLVTISVTGLLLWVAMPKRRKAGLVALAASLVGFLLLGAAIFS